MTKVTEKLNFPEIWSACSSAANRNLVGLSQLGKHIQSPRYDAPYDLLKPLHNTLEESTLMGRALDCAGKRSVVKAGFFYCASQTSFWLKSPFALIDVITLRALHSRQSKGAQAPWNTFALPLTMPIWMVSQLGAAIGFVAKTSLMVVVFPVYLGVMALKYQISPGKVQALLVCRFVKTVASEAVIRCPKEQVMKQWAHNKQAVSKAFISAEDAIKNLKDFVRDEAKRSPSLNGRYMVGEMALQLLSSLLAVAKTRIAQTPDDPTVIIADLIKAVPLVSLIQYLEKMDKRKMSVRDSKLDDEVMGADVLQDPDGDMMLEKVKANFEDILKHLSSMRW